MKNDKKKRIIGVSLGLLFGVIIFLFLNTDRYITQNIRAIDKADSVSIVTEEKSIPYSLDDDELFTLVSYGGSILKVDSFFAGLFSPYSNKLTKIDINIRYTKGESILATADVFKSNENSQEYILYMNNVYWSTGSKLKDLLELIE